jgi:Patatin phospholipase
MTREKEIRFSSRTRAGTDQFKHVQSLRRAVARLLEKLPDELQNSPEARNVTIEYRSVPINTINRLDRLRELAADLVSRASVIVAPSSGLAHVAKAAKQRGCWRKVGANMPDPFTIRIFVPGGEPEGLRIIDRMNWTGLGVVFPREEWAKIKSRSEFGKPGVYVLIGYVTEDDLATLYIGQGDVLRNRLDSHFVNKDFWSKAVVFVSSAASGGLNRAHATWLEHALISERS